MSRIISTITLTKFTNLLLKPTKLAVKTTILGLEIMKIPILIKNQVLLLFLINSRKVKKFHLLLVLDFTRFLNRIKEV